MSEYLLLLGFVALTFGLAMVLMGMTKEAAARQAQEGFRPRPSTEPATRDAKPLGRRALRRNESKNDITRRLGTASWRIEAQRGPAAPRKVELDKAAAIQERDAPHSVTISQPTEGPQPAMVAARSSPRGESPQTSVVTEQPSPQPAKSPPAAAIVEQASSQAESPRTVVVSPPASSTSGDAEPVEAPQPLGVSERVEIFASGVSEFAEQSTSGAISQQSEESQPTPVAQHYETARPERASEAADSARQAEPRRPAAQPAAVGGAEPETETTLGFLAFGVAALVITAILRYRFRRR